MSNSRFWLKPDFYREDFQMFELTPIASATPDDTYKVSRRFRWIPDHILKAIEAIEGDHFNNIVEDVSERGIYLREFNPQARPITVSIRKDARLREGRGSFRRLSGDSTLKRSGRRAARRQAKLNACIHKIYIDIQVASDDQLRERDIDMSLFYHHKFGDAKTIAFVEGMIDVEIQSRRWRKRTV